jgi:hypothetical protein
MTLLSCGKIHYGNHVLKEFERYCIFQCTLNVGGPVQVIIFSISMYFECWRPRCPDAQYPLENPDFEEVNHL